MDFQVMIQTYNVVGAHLTLSLIPDFLLQGAPDFGPAVRELSVTLHFPTSGPPKERLEAYYAEFNKNRTLLPKIVFHRARETAEIDVASELIDGVDLKTDRDLSLATFQKGAVEVIHALQLLRKQITPKDDFDLEAFLRHCQSMTSRLPATDADLLALNEEIEQARATKLAAMSPWEKLGVDWRDYHPDARKLLDDPFYWDLSHDFAPNGNDTGADLLADYRKWNKRHPAGDPLDFYHQLVKSWGYDGEPDQDVADEAAVALAFAELKIRAECRRPVIALALAAIGRQRQQAIDATNWPQKAERLKCLEMLEAKLKQLPP